MKKKCRMKLKEKNSIMLWKRHGLLVIQDMFAAFSDIYSDLLTFEYCLKWKLTLLTYKKYNRIPRK